MTLAFGEIVYRFVLFEMMNLNGFVVYDWNKLFCGDFLWVMFMDCMVLCNPEIFIYLVFVYT